jgi:hypothetical protein
MTEELVRGCARANHLIAPGGATLRAGRASMHILDVVGRHRFASACPMRPLIWLVEVVYCVVASKRALFSRFLFRTG